MRSRVVLALVGALAVASAVFVARDARARATWDSPYGFDRTWTATVRFVRVDLGLKITEKDDGSGYLLFDYVSSESGQKPSSGSVEVVRGSSPAEPVRVVVQLPKMPHYHEQTMVDGLQRKLRAEYGEPPARTPDSKAKARDEASRDDAGVE
jgi:hypothetical protein